jgi:hypothetical protein
MCKDYTDPNASLLEGLTSTFIELATRGWRLGASKSWNRIALLFGNDIITPFLGPAPVHLRRAWRRNPAMRCPHGRNWENDWRIVWLL